MAKEIKLGVKGYYNGPNWLQWPEGALYSFSNMLVRDTGVAETRRGYSALGSATWSPSANASAIYVWKDGSTFAYLIHRSTTLGYTTDGNSYTDYSGTYTASDQRTRFAEAKENLHFTSTTGVYRLDAYNGTPIVVGLQKPLAITTASAGAGTASTDPSAVAYRACLKFTDANGNVFRSAPSGRSVFRNSGLGTVNVTVTVKIPASLSTSYVVELYRSACTSSATEEPSDEMGLVYETFLESGEVSAKSIDITDVVPDAMRGATGYFCPSQEGIGAGNERPPLANDIAWFKDSMFYSGTTGKHRLILRLMNTSGSASSTALEADDTVTIAGVTYTAKASPANESQFSLVTSSTQQVNVRETVLSLVAKINAHSSNSTVYAYYMSGPDDPAGIFMVEERGLGGASFAAVSSVAAAWTPELPSGGTTISSAADAYPNRVHWSKPGQPEAVPLLNYLDVGSKSDPIARIYALRDSLYVFKKNEGIFRITGSGGVFGLTEHDKTVRIIGRDTVAPLGNELYCFSDHGVVAVSDSGTRIVSKAIDSAFRYYYQDGSSGTLRATAHNYAHAVGYEEHGLYVLFLPNDTTPSSWYAYAYSAPNDSWAIWYTLGAVVSALGSAEKRQLTMAFNGQRKLHLENIITNQTFYIDGSSAIESGMGWQADAGNPSVYKQWTKVDLLLADSPQAAAQPTTITFSFTTNLSNTATSVAVATGATTLQPVYVVSCPVPIEHQLAAWLRVAISTSEAAKPIAVVGLVVSYEEGGDYAGR